MLPIVDALAPGVLVAQAHRPLGQLVQPGALRQAHRPAVGPGDRPGLPAAGLRGLRHLPPDVPLRVRLEPARLRRDLWLDRRYRLGRGRVLALYVMGYTLGRGWIEMLRIDTVQINNVLGLRLNVWTSIVLFVLATAYFVWAGMRGSAARRTCTPRGTAPSRADVGRRHRFVGDQRAGRATRRRPVRRL